RGPAFEYEPPSQIDFDNSTGAVAVMHGQKVNQCRTSGGRPRMDRLFVKSFPGVQHLRPDGSMVFAPFTPIQYRRKSTMQYTDASQLMWLGR
ncbi:hypothetical protein CEXT_811411, partial [Caerostris extrusa]